MHKSYAMFKMHAKGHNDSIEIGLIIAADSRMAGWMIALLCLLQLKPAVKSMIASLNYLECDQRNKLLEELFKINKFWELLFLILQSLYPILKIL